MNRRSILSMSAMTVLGLALVPSGTVAQQKSLKDQLVELGLSFRRQPNVRMEARSGVPIQKASPSSPTTVVFLRASCAQTAQSSRRTTVCRVRQTTTR
jgi:hypothetical protein